MAGGAVVTLPAFASRHGPVVPKCMAGLSCIGVPAVMMLFGRNAPGVAELA